MKKTIQLILACLLCLAMTWSAPMGLAEEGIVFSDGFFKTLFATYSRTAQDVLKRYEDDASINSLRFDRHEESLSIETFANGIKIAAGVIMKDPLGSKKCSMLVDHEMTAY